MLWKNPYDIVLHHVCIAIWTVCTFIWWCH